MNDKYKIIDGNEACSYVSYNFTEVAGIYPITPSSTMAELTDTWSKQGKLNYFGDTVEVVEMQSEAGAAGMIHGSLQAGCLTTTYTASQGLLLMIPNMYKMAGEQLPCVINVAARSLATHALSILGDHQDIYATRPTGFAILASSSVQQVMDLTGVAHLSAIKGKVPFLNFFDGFRTSHELQKIELIDTNKLKTLIDKDALREFRKRALSPANPVTRGTAQNDDIYFQATEVRNKYYDELPDIVNNYLKEVSKITKRTYHPFNYYGDKNATRVIVAMGSVCETIKETIDYLNSKGEKVGLIEVHLYRPFSTKYFLKALPNTTKQIAVLDRTKEAGSNGEPLYLDVVNVIKSAAKQIEVIGGRYGLSSKNTSPKEIKAVYDFLKNSSHFTNFTVGINDDVTNLSIPVDDSFIIPNKAVEFLIYGYGSDGMVSASKDLMKITGSHSNAYVQGYFQYDSKKSGGVTKSHLRFSKNPITSTYYVETPQLVVCTKDSYLEQFDILGNIKNNATFILNTAKPRSELLNYLPNEVKKNLIEKNIKMFVINATGLSKKIGLGDKISTIMEAVIFKAGHIIDYNFAIDRIKESVKKKFKNKGNNIVEKNIKAIDEALDNLKEFNLEGVTYKEDEPIKEESFFEIIFNRKGDSLPVSSFLDKSDGSWDEATTKYEKREISQMAPCFIPENCISCNQCSFVCPHAVIRPFLLDEQEVKNAPSSLRDKLKDANIKDKNLKFVVSASIQDCTNCRLCVDTCPGLKGNKALEMKPVKDLKEQGAIEEWNYLEEKVTEKDVLNTRTVKGSQFRKPKFEFPGACAGCGETPYLKLLTQLFKERLVMANATGCSSIYGASAPSIPYSIPWANSLFEDNAEYGYGMAVADRTMKERIKKVIERNVNKIDEDELDAYMAYVEEVNEDSANNLYSIVDHSPISTLKSLKNYIKKKSFWLVGGDGWAYDIGFSGIDHVLANKENVNILVLDTEVYSNTGGQASKSTRTGAVARFAASGKETAKKDLAKIALSYPHVYVGTISLGANMQHTLKILLEAERHEGPSIIIAYAPCISHGILNNLNSLDQEKLAVESGYFPLFHYDPTTGKFTLDSKADFEKYNEYMDREDRYKMLKNINPEKYEELKEQNKINAMKRYNYYKKLTEEEN